MAATDMGMGPMPKFPRFAAHRPLEEELAPLAPVSWFFPFPGQGRSTYRKVPGFVIAEGKDPEKPYRKIYGAPLALPHVILARTDGRGRTRTEPIFSSLHFVRAPHSLLSGHSVVKVDRILCGGFFGNIAFAVSRPLSSFYALQPELMEYTYTCRI